MWMYDDGVALHGEGGLALLDIDGGTVLLTLEHGDAVGEVPLIRGEMCIRDRSMTSLALKWKSMVTVPSYFSGVNSAVW